MKLTRSTREQVADFLRCAADHCSDDAERTGGMPFSTAAKLLDIDRRIGNLASRAWMQAWSDASGRHVYANNGVTSFKLTLLEAAIGVEEGSLPRTRRDSLNAARGAA